MLILTPTVRGEYQFMKFTDDYDKALKDKNNDYVWLPQDDKRIAYYILNIKKNYITLFNMKLDI